MDLSKQNINKLRTELWTCHLNCEQRCLRKSCEWAEDLLFALPEEGESKILSKLENEIIESRPYNPHLEHAKSCFELHEYDRAAHLIKDHSLDDDLSRFIRYFAKYKAAEKKRVDLMNEVTTHLPKKALLKFNELRDSLERSMELRQPDGWLMYVYALVLHKFNLRSNAVQVLEQAINMTPICWSSWYLMTLLVDSEKQLHALKLPEHPFKVFFYYMIRLDLDIKQHDPWILVGYKETKNFLDKYFKSSLFIKTIAAKTLGYEFNNYKDALTISAQIRQDDPYRLDSMDVYSNLLFITKNRKELAKLAYDVERVDPLTPEANNCIANSFTCREQHTKAIVYFNRALRLHPDHVNSWTLVGHEYLEMKSTDKAIQAYLYALSINKRDCRAWIGLGNTYEAIMSGPNVASPNYERCLYYYSQVGKYRPKDPIMMMAMRNVFEKMNLNESS